MKKDLTFMEQLQPNNSKMYEEEYGVTFLASKPNQGSFKDEMPDNFPSGVKKQSQVTKKNRKLTEDQLSFLQMSGVTGYDNVKWPIRPLFHFSIIFKDHWATMIFTKTT